MPGLDTNEVAVAAGAGVYYAPVGTSTPVLGTPPAAPWIDLGYISEDGVTHTTSRSSENFGAWQSASPILVLVTEITDTFGFALRQWNRDTFAFVYGDGGATAPTFEPAKGTIPESALYLLWDWLEFPSHLYVPRGRITGDTEDILTRTAPSDLPVELISTPSGSEPVWQFDTQHPAFSGLLTARASGGKGENAKAAAA